MLFLVSLNVIFILQSLFCRINGFLVEVAEIIVVNFSIFILEDYFRGLW